MTYDPRAPGAEEANHVAFPLSVTARFAWIGAAGLPAVAALAAALGAGLAGLAIALAVYMAGVAVALRGMRRYPHDRIGWANAVTLGRLGLVACLVPALDAPAGVAVLAVAGVALALDGVDGWLARRQGLASAFGARFDMEVDAALALTLAAHGALAGAVHPAILLLGLPRYLFGAAQQVWPWLRGPLPERFSRKAVCVFQIGVLIAVLIPGLPREAADALVLAAAGALAWSFWVDIRHLRQG
ncbi:CDP-alcohol phosphatidyltransferase family protein [Jannaschia seohaensis]|uniref:Phosphatidylglycerophosphate synthase n=1 Tax=Jannaschia seohaensis TaxID=475081 RepID=A0A2Y9A2E8_9RHOB|nr:CDP-alcohol phosphatidyltransferase family protein [Jannaschia seohaensis]PWJ22443.1 phosphatidylglycerophosphate synthase [Jannaschia seohaensis]SSA38721.1 Phosphatidylglycerophosphate synthase [Jannaschia seohaensis]